jgi:hypothetical protein
LKVKFEKEESIYKAPSSKYKPVLNIDSDDEEDLSPEEEGTFAKSAFSMVLLSGRSYKS